MYRKKWSGWLKHIDFILLDMLCLQLAFIVSYEIRHGFHNPWRRLPYVYMNVALLFIDIFVFIFSNSLKNVLKRGYYKEFAQTFKHVVFVELLSVFYLFSLQLGESYSRTILYLTGVIYAILTYCARLLWKKHLNKKMESSNKRSLLIVTTSRMLDRVIENIASNNYQMFHIKGIAIIDGKDERTEVGGIPVVATDSAAYDYVCREWIDEVFLKLPSDMPNLQDIVDRYTQMGLAVHIEIMEYLDFSAQHQFIETVGKYTVLTVSINTATTGEIVIKRLMDIAGGLAGCLITCLLVIVIGPMIYFSSPGPIFFAQERVGKNGRKFKMYKFRSMYMDAEERKKELMKENKIGDGMMFKLDWDPRIIGNKVMPDGSRKKGIGNFIRESSLDEFPQFFNVLKGDMSLVGTRPPTVDEWEKYDYHHRARLAVKPGVTGMWQVSGRSNITDFGEVVALDMKYIKEWNIGLDFKILFKTVSVVLHKDGSM